MYRTDSDSEKVWQLFIEFSSLLKTNISFDEWICSLESLLFLNRCMCFKTLLISITDRSLESHVAGMFYENTIKKVLYQANETHMKEQKKSNLNIKLVRFTTIPSKRIWRAMKHCIGCVPFTLFENGAKSRNNILKKFHCTCENQFYTHERKVNDMYRIQSYSYEIRVYSI